MTSVRWVLAAGWLLLCGSGEGAGPNSLSKAELDEGWILLFDGETLFGWAAASQADWRVADGAITVSAGEPGLLLTTSPFADYELQVDFRAAGGTNSGIFLRTPSKPSDPAGDCYELNIADPDISPFPTGSFVGRKKGEATTQSTDWRTYRVLAQGARLTVWLDGQPVLDYTDPQPIGRGFVGLQLNKGKVEFKNVKLRPLGLASIFNSKDLSGWKVYPGQRSVFSVRDGSMHVRDGRGQIETEATYGDFVLQLEVFSNGKHLNSGIFFRSIPGDLMNGYESQIHNGFRDGDRNQPIDFGTGGFYRYQKARRVVADDFQWFHQTLVVSGAHMAAWVNGFPVSDWTDTRPPDPNPRRGQRLAAGTIIIQGHDPTTDLSFRNFRISETRKR